MRCPGGHDNRVGAAFCMVCGAKLALACSQCGRELPPSARFCDGCGAAQDEAAGAATGAGQAGVPVLQESPHTYAPPPELAAKIDRARGAIEGERRTVTVLFIDAVGSTPVGEKLDPEEYNRIVHTATDKMIEAVNRFEGTVTQFRGDGIMAVFGAPIAHEDSARRAVAAALVMRESLAAYAAEMATDGTPAFAYRIGLNTGPVIVGSIGSDFSMDYTAIGDTVNLAARMEQSAAAGAICISEHTQRHVAPYFELRDLGPIAVKGKAEPVHVYEVVRERPSRTRLDASEERGLTPYVGRREQLDTLRAHFELAQRGQGQVVFVQGEPGMGKSRLLLEFRRELGDEAVWLEGRCISWGNNFPYLPIVDIVRDAFGVEEGDDDADITSAIDKRAATWDAAASASAAPHLKYLLSVDSQDGSPGMDPLERRGRVLDALRGLIMQESRERPVVAVVEDLHWADEQSEQALAAMVDAVASSPVLMILTYRPGYVHALGDRTYFGRLALSNLPPDSSASMVEGVLQGEGVPPRLQAMIVAKAEGNPFFIEEVSRSLVDTGVLRRTNGMYTLARPVDSVTIPDTIQEVILSRIDRLQRNAKEAVQYASVIGREFPVRLLKHIASMEKEMDGLLGELKSLELIYEKSYYPELEYMFKHALTQEVALSTLLGDRRKALHRQVAAAIELLYADRLTEQHEALAHHYYQGEEWEKACEYATMVARRAASLHAPGAVIEHTTRAIDAAMNCDPDRCPEAAEPAMYRLRGLAYEAMGEFDGARADHEAAITSARQRGDSGAEWQGHADLGMLWAQRDYEHAGDYWRQGQELARRVGDERMVARSLNLVGNWLTNTEHPIQGIEHHEEALAIFERLDDPRGTSESLDFLSLALALAGDLKGALDRALEGAEIYRRLDNKQGLANLLAGLGFFTSGAETLTLTPLENDPDQLISYSDEGRHIAEEISWLPVQAYALCQRCVALLSLGEYTAALAAGEQALRITTDIGHTQWRTFANYDLAGVYFDLHHRDRAVEHFERATALALQIGSAFWLRATESNYIRCLTHFGELERAAEVLSRNFRDDLPMIAIGQRGMWLARAELYIALGEVKQGVDILDQLGASAKNAGPGGVRAVPYLALVRGRALLSLGRPDAAEADLRAALDIARRLKMRPLEWRALDALGELLLAASRDADARGCFADALAIVQQLAAAIDDTALRHLYLISEPVERLRAKSGAGAF